MKRSLKNIWDLDGIIVNFLTHLIQSGSFSPRAVDKRLGDPICELSVEALMVEGPSNISEIASWISKVKGRCARSTVRDRLEKLRKWEVVERKANGNYVLSDGFLISWIRLVMAEPATTTTP